MALTNEQLAQIKKNAAENAEKIRSGAYRNDDVLQKEQTSRDTGVPELKMERAEKQRVQQWKQEEERQQKADRRQKTEQLYRNATAQKLTAQQVYRAAVSATQKNLDAYTSSPEYLQKREDQIQKSYREAQTDEELQSAIASGKDYTDKTAADLKAEKDYYQSRADAEKDREIMSRDISVMMAWPEEDQKLLKLYVQEKDVRDDPFTVSNPFIYIPASGRSSKYFSALAEKYGAERVNEIASSYGRYLHQKDAESLQKQTEQAVGNIPGAIAHNILATGARQIGGVSSTIGRISELLNRDKRYSTLETYRPTDALSIYGNTVQNATARNIEGDGGNAGRKALSMGYQGIVSAADSLLRIAMTGGKEGLSLGLMATGAFGNAMSEATAQGATPEQALILSTVKAGLEVATEKIPLDNLLNVAKSAPTKIGPALLNALKQAGVEATSEEVGLIGELLAEAVILQKKSGYQQKIGELVANGKSYDDAKEQANREILDEALQTAVVSGFSGAVSSAGASLFASAVNGKNGTGQIGAEAQSDEQGEEQQHPIMVDQQTDNSNSEAKNAAQRKFGMDAVKNSFLNVLGGKRKSNGTATETAIDSGIQPVYNDNKNIQGGNRNGTGLQEYDGAGSSGNPAQGLAGVQQGNGSDNQGRWQSGGVAVNSGILRVSEQLQEAQHKRGTQTYPVLDTTADPARYEQALKAGRESDTENGWCVTPKSAQELRDGNVRTFMNENGTVGVGVAPDGDIVAVFKNKNGGPRKALETLMPIAIEQGGDRLDCYGEGLVKAYSQYGFEPVARVEFNPEYANEGWTPDKKTPYIYVMKHNGDSADAVVSKIGSYNVPSKEQLDSLPTYGKDEYDSAIAYRDSLMKQREADTQYGDSGMDHSSVGAANRDFAGTAAYDELLTDGNVQPARASDAKYEEVPIRDTYGRKVSENAQNVMNSDVISERDITTAKQLIAEGAFGHDTQKMADVRDRVYKEIQSRSISDSVREVTRAAASGKLSEYDVAKVQTLFAMLTKKEGKAAQRMAGELLVDMQQMATQSARQLNMFKLLRMLTPEGQLSAVKSSVQRYVDNLNKSRSEKKQVNVEIPEELERDYLDAAKDGDSSEKSVSAGIANVISEEIESVKGQIAETVVKNAIEEIDQGAWYSGSGRESNIQTNDMAERVGQRVADSLSRIASEQNRSIEDVLFGEIMRFANDKANSGRSATTQSDSRNLSALRDHYRYRAFFQTAWDIARNRVETAMLSMRSDDPRIQVLEQFLASGDEVVGIENKSPVSSTDYANPKSTLRRGTKEAASAAGIRMDNRSETARNEARKKMRDVLVENAQEKEKAAQQIARVAMDGLNLDEKSAETMAADIVRAFYSDLADQSARRVAQLFSDNGRTLPKKAQQTLAQKIEKLYNMGAFSYPEYRSAVMESIFGMDGIDIPDSLIDQFVQAAEERKQETLDQIYKFAAAQIPATLGEKFNSLRHMGMLGSPMTHIRNFGATGAFRPMASIKRTISAAIQAVTLDKQNRTAAVIGVGKESRELLNWAEADAKTETAKSMMQGTYQNGDDARNAVSEYRTTFKNKGLESTRKFISNALEAEDMVWKKREYALSLASFLKSRGYTAKQAQSGAIPASVMDEGRQFAVQEALKSTFNDRNYFSDLLSKFRKKGNRPMDKALNIMAEGILPYTRTPANVGVRGLEYSPAGLAKGFIDLAVNVRSGKKTAAQCIDEIAAGLTGTGVMALGAGLAAGMIPGVRLVGKIPEDDEAEENTQEYAIEIGGVSIGIGWVAPTTIPLFIGANLYNRFKSAAGDGDLDAWDIASSIIGSLQSSLDPVLELSCMSGLNDAIEKMSYEDTAGEKLTSLVYNAATGYFLQIIPTTFGQFEKAVEKNKKSTYTNAENQEQRMVERTIASTFRKLPGDPYQIDKVDAYGNIVKEPDNPVLRALNAFVNQSSVQKIDRSPLTMEIKRLNAAQPVDVSTPAISKIISFTDKDGVAHSRYRLSAQEFSAVEKAQKTTQFEILNSLIQTDTYQAMNEAEKAKAFQYVYDYAREKALEGAIDGYQGGSAWMDGIDGNEANAIMQKVISGSFSDAVGALADKDGKENATGNLDRVYAIYDSMDGGMQEEFRKTASKKVSYYLDAKESGVSTETFAGLYRTFDELDKREDLKPAQKEQQWVYELKKAQEAGTITKNQMDTLKEKMGYLQFFRPDGGSVEKLTVAGLGADNAKKIANAISALKPESGYKTVRDVQKAESISKSGMAEKDKITALKAYLTDAQDENLDQMIDLGFNSGDYVAALRIYDDESDAGGKGTKQRIIQRYRYEFGVDNATATAIYNIYH